VPQIPNVSAIRTRTASECEDPKTVSFYAPTHRRAVRVAQVSEAATALAAARGGLGGDQNGTSRILLADLLDGGTVIERQRLRLVRSLDPELVPRAAITPAPHIVARGQAHFLAMYTKAGWSTVLKRLSRCGAMIQPLTFASWPTFWRTSSRLR
jgi:hypothetical protein